MQIFGYRSFYEKNGETGRDSGESIEILLDKLKKYTEKWLHNTDINTVKMEGGQRFLKIATKWEKERKGFFGLLCLQAVEKRLHLWPLLYSMR